MVKLKLQYFGHLMWRVDSLKKTWMLGGIGGRSRGGQHRMRLDSITDLMGMSLSKLRKLMMDREAWHAAIHGVRKSRTWLSDWTELNWSSMQAEIMTGLVQPSARGVCTVQCGCSEQTCGWEEWGGEEWGGCKSWSEPDMVLQEHSH